MGCSDAQHRDKTGDSASIFAWRCSIFPVVGAHLMGEQKMAAEPGRPLKSHFWPLIYTNASASFKRLHQIDTSYSSQPSTSCWNTQPPKRAAIHLRPGQTSGPASRASNMLREAVGELDLGHGVEIVSTWRRAAGLVLVGGV